MTAISTNRRKFLTSVTAAASSMYFGAPLIAQSHELVIISNLADVAQRKALDTITTRFGKEAGVTVSVNNMDHEAHKTAIRNYLSISPPDINFWFSGESMRNFVENDLFSDITDLVEEEGWMDVVPAIASTTVNGKQYGLPISGTLWGMWYRQDNFNEYGFKVPKSYDDFFTLLNESTTAGMTPVSIGTKNPWPAAGWFNHMNLRINGLAHHQALMAGKIAYTDTSVKNVLDSWATLVITGLFSKNMTSIGWEQAAAALAQKKAAMMNLGAFISSAFSAEDKSQLRFAPFPTINAAIPRYENFTVDSIHIPSNARNPVIARQFLSYFYRPENLKLFLASSDSIPARSDIDMSHNVIIQTALEDMKNIAGMAQYYDRDTNPDVAKAGMKGFQEFMVFPERANRILADIERARTRVYGAV